jgi:hypothetical protein
MSRGILHITPEVGSVFSNVDIGELSHRDILSEQPTLSDLILPGTGRSFSEEFKCLLRLLCAKGEPE